MRLTDLKSLNDPALAALLHEAALDVADQAIDALEGEAPAVMTERLARLRTEAEGTSLKALVARPDDELVAELLALAKDIVVEA